jgi:tubulin polyglutamylase TTLL6/13
VLKSCAEKFGWLVTYEEEDTNFNLFWIDTGVAAERLMKLKRYQKINHFPNMSFLARKARMGKTLNRMLVVHGKDYKFFPQTWSLPAEWSDFMAQFSKGKKNRTFIVKPDAVGARFWSVRLLPGC